MENELYHFKYVDKHRGPTGKWIYTYKNKLRGAAKDTATIAKLAVDKVNGLNHLNRVMKEKNPAKKISGLAANAAKAIKWKHEFNEYEKRKTIVAKGKNMVEKAISNLKNMF